MRASGAISSTGSTSPLRRDPRSPWGPASSSSSSSSSSAAAASSSSGLLSAARISSAPKPSLGTFRPPYLPRVTKGGEEGRAAKGGMKGGVRPEAVAVDMEHSHALALHPGLLDVGGAHKHLTCHVATKGG